MHANHLRHRSLPAKVVLYTGKWHVYLSARCAEAPSWRRHSVNQNRPLLSLSLSLSVCVCVCMCVCQVSLAQTVLLLLVRHTAHLLG